MNNQPPRWMDRLLNWFCKPELIEEITGDMRELYFERLEIQGKRAAQARYAMDIIRFFRRSNIRFFQSYRSSQNSISMVKSYFTIAFRNLRKNPFNTVINLLGLSIAVAYGVRAYSHYQWINRIDQFHDKKEQVHMVTYFSEKEGTITQYGNVPLPLGEVMAQNFPEVQNTCRVKRDNIVVKHRDNVFYESIWYAEPSYLEMLSFPMKWGSEAGLRDKKSVIISEEISDKYFAENNPVGIEIEMIFSPTDKRSFTIAGVAAEFPSASSMHFDILLHFDNLQSVHPDYTSGNWEQLIDGTLVQLTPTADVRSIEHRMTPYQETFNEIEEHQSIASFRLEPISTAYRQDIEDRFSISWLIEGPFMILGTITLFLLLLSCLNYTNIAIFTATKRLKEIGLRKSLGAGKKMIISQFLVENIFIGTITIILGYLLAIGYLVPSFEEGIEVDLGLSIFDWRTLLFLFFILMVITVLSGIYPAFYVAKYKVSEIFRSDTTFGKRNFFTKIFLSVQLILAAMAISFSIMTVENAHFIKGRSWGYDHESVSYMEVPDPTQFNALSNELSKVSGVSMVSGSVHHMGKRHKETTAELNEQPISINLHEIDHQYFQTMGLRLQSGRSFIDRASDLKSVIVNTTFIKSTGITSPLSTSIQIEEEKYQIIGVVEDFHAYYFEAPIVSTVLKLATENFGYLSVKSEHSDQERVLEAMKEEWARTFPDIPFQGGYQKDIWGSVYWSRIDGAQGFFHEISIICMLLVSLGLYGLVALNVGGRIREFSIRKVLGAGQTNLTRTIIGPYLILFLIALIVAVPLSYVFVDAALGFIWTYHVPMNINGITVATVALISVLAIVVLLQVKKVMKSDPVIGLRTE